jgi:hypothetical protein
VILRRRWSSIHLLAYPLHGRTIRFCRSGGRFAGKRPARYDTLPLHDRQVVGQTLALLHQKGARGVSGLFETPTENNCDLYGLDGPKSCPSSTAASFTRRFSEARVCRTQKTEIRVRLGPSLGLRHNVRRSPLSSMRLSHPI